MSFSGMVKEELSRHIGSGKTLPGLQNWLAIFTFCGSLMSEPRWKKNPQAPDRK